MAGVGTPVPAPYLLTIPAPEAPPSRKLWRGSITQWAWVELNYRLTIRRAL